MKIYDNRFMKKKFICVSFLFCLCSCSGGGPNVTPSGSITPTPSPSVSITPTPTPSPTVTEKVDSPLLFTEFNVGYYVQNRALEIYNSGNTTIDLSEYKISIYRGYATNSTEEIVLEGHLEAKKTYIICYSNSNDDIKMKSDLISDLFLNDGSYPMTLEYQGHIVDILGTIGYAYNYARKTHLVKKKEYLYNETIFIESHWTYYPLDTYDTLGNVDVISESTLLNGPKLTNEVLAKPFVGEDNLGGGGLISVTLNYNIDGDTSKFNYGYSLSEYDISGSLSTRYYGINTPEIAHSIDETSDPYGDEAKAFTSSKLNKAKKIYIQSVEGYSFKETYSRMLGYVWVSEVSNPSLSDYYLLNFEILKNGLARLAFVDFTDSYEKNMNYQGVYYIEYLRQANLYAINNKLNIYSDL